jgi:cytosine deaminase
LAARLASLLLRNIRPWGESGTRDLAVVDGRFVAAEAEMKAQNVIDAEGRLAVPGFVDPHLHLDKALLADGARPNASGTLEEAIAIAGEKKRAYRPEEVAERAGRIIETAVANGVTHLRTHVDVDPLAELRGLEGVVRAREKYRNCVDIQIVAFPQEGILRSPGTEKLLRDAMARGADVVGGMPANEATTAASARHIDIVFAIAKEFSADVDMHVDETDDPNARTLEMLADKTVHFGWQGRATAGHCCALARYPDDYAARVMEKVAAAGIHIVTLPATNLMIQGRGDAQPKRRGITRVRELLERGVNVTFGQDNVADIFYPFGKNDPLQVALLLAHAAHMSLPRQIEQVLTMATCGAAKALRLEGYGLRPGDAADLAIIDAPDAAQAIRFQPPRRWVIKRGRVVAETTLERLTTR